MRSAGAVRKSGSAWRSAPIAPACCGSSSAASLWLVVIGVALGGLLSIWASRYIETLLFKVTARDPVTFAIATTVLVGAALLAGWLPARRAASIDPATVLRDS